MNALMLVVRLTLAAVFAVAGVAKLIDLRGSVQAMAGFGLPARWARPAGILLPMAELVVAVLLIPARTAWMGALGGLVLLLAFIAGIAVNLAQGRRPDCHCFGQLHSRPIGWPTLVRNGMLALLAVLLVSQGPAGQPSLLGLLAGSSGLAYFGIMIGVLLVAAVVAEGWFLVNLLQQNGRLLLRVEALETGLGVTPVGAGESEQAAGLAPGTPAPPFRLPDLTGKRLALGDLLAAGSPVLLLFSDPNCEPCTDFLPEVAGWQQDRVGLTVAVVSRGSAALNHRRAEAIGLSNVLLQEGREVSLAYEAGATPSAVLIDRQGKIASPLALGPDAIRDLAVNPALAPNRLQLHASGAVRNHGNGVNGRQPSQASEPALGSAAPALRLPDLDGALRTLEDFRDKETLLLFWNPGCGFCQRMLANLRAWEERQGDRSPCLVLISTGTPETNRAYGLRAPILLDTSFAVGKRYGAQGTPSATLVDAQGRIASETVVGEQAILNLMNASTPFQLAPIR